MATAAHLHDNDEPLETSSHFINKIFQNTKRFVPDMATAIICSGCGIKLF
uniref:Uncharacterized protein n=1 Tax=Arundo donax TaxID=35708 RepID=A0A0A9AT28_ARUDO